MDEVRRAGQGERAWAINNDRNEPQPTRGDPLNQTVLNLAARAGVSGFDTTGRGEARTTLRLNQLIFNGGLGALGGQPSQRAAQATTAIVSDDIARMVREGSAASVETIGRGNPPTPVTPRGEEQFVAQARRTDCCDKLQSGSFKPPREQ